MPNINRSTDDPQDTGPVSTVAPDRFPGWYLDPRNALDERFWNGTEWTNLTRAAPRLNDYLGPIEPTLLAILGEPETGLIEQALDEPALSQPALDTMSLASDTSDLSEPAADLASHAAMADGDWDDRSSLTQVQAFMAN